MGNKFCVLYNPLAGNKKGTEKTEELKKIMEKDQLRFFDMTQVKDYEAFLRTLADDEKLLITGGDGTLNRFVNAVQDVQLPSEVYYFACGSGNDFWNDLGKKSGDYPVNIIDYIRDLPIVTVNGRSYRFINGIGFGIDGYCCEMGDKLRAESDRPVNYTNIAVKGLISEYKPVNATITVDGKRFDYKKVWLAPTMYGRYYGGGMMPAPRQNRRDKERFVTVMTLSGTGKLRTLMIFPSIFKGEHVKYTRDVRLISGHDITVEFDRPTPLQIDGETIRNVSSYRVHIG